MSEAVHAFLGDSSISSVIGHFGRRSTVQILGETRSEGSSSSGRTAVQGHITEGRRWWEYGGGIMLDSLVKHQEHTNIGCIAQRRSKGTRYHISYVVKGD